MDPRLLPERAMSCQDCPSRRELCVAVGAGAGLIAVGIAACDNGDARLSTGSLDDDSSGSGPSKGNGNQNGNGNSGPPDLAQASTGPTGGPPDMAQGTTGGSPDLSSGSGGKTCSGMLNAGPSSGIAMNQGKHLTDNSTYDLFVCRDSGGLFTVDAQCTHAGCDVKLQSGGWYCPCHGARFNFDGTHPTSPAFSPLANYAVCVDASGNVFVDINSTVSSTTRA
jgi:Rieske Fe-S protein